MILNRIYYLLKPLLPWQLRLAMRRWRANRRRIAYADIWPINHKAGATPPSWPGWPDQKRFAVILTHDVEGLKGLGRIEALMEVEKKAAFRSSFNLVPEGEYRVPDSLRKTLDDNGFEVGVHGLEHDGKLYNSKAGFAHKAKCIREYLTKWGACGFRSPLMQHKLAWLHELKAEYDSSTFDTDPFEPQPHGVATIFPFWVPGPNGEGYVELPYTLVQDLTLFTVLREKTIDIWKRKVDWIAEQGGMVLLNTHPDYMCFEGERMRDEFPISLYEELLRYIQEKYAGQFWGALPREVSRYYCNSVPVACRNTRRRVCMITHSNYEGDNRVRRYAEALVKRGDEVDVIAIAKGSIPLGEENISGVTVDRIQHRERNEAGKWDYAWRLLRFHVFASINLTRRHRELPYDLIHVHNVPDFLVFAAWYPKFMGVKLILDVHDIVPEFFSSKFGARKEDVYMTLLKRIEKASASFADHVIISNDLWRETFVSRSAPRDKTSVFLNHVDPSIFYPRVRARKDERVVILFHGTFNWHQGLEVAIEAFARLKNAVPKAEFHIYGGGHQEKLIQLADQLGVGESVKFCGGVSLDEIPNIVVNADLGVVPKRARSFGNEAYSTKIMEFMSQGVPVVVSRTKIDSFYFDESAVCFFESENVQAMTEAMLEVLQNADKRQSLIRGGHDYVVHHGWEARKLEYFQLVDSLATERFGDSDVTQVKAARDAQADLPS